MRINLCGVLDKSKQILVPSLLSIFLLIAHSAQAQTSDETTPNYTVEVIVFESLALKGWTEEHWPEILELPIEIEAANSVFIREKLPLFIQERPKNLEDVAEKMHRGYRILFHQAWSQNAYGSADKSPAVLIENDIEGGAQLLGTLKLYKTRFAHIEVDLDFERQIPNAIRDAFAENQQIPVEELPESWRFNLKDSRKIKVGELHYIDHPLFGVLVQIQKNN